MHLTRYFDVADYDVASQRTLLTTTTPSAQTMLADISSSSKNLVGKVAVTMQQDNIRLE